MKFLIVGGEQRSDKHTREFHRFKKAIVVRVDTELHTAERVFEYTTPAEYCADDDDPSIIFKAAHLEGDRLYLCTQTEVLILQLPQFEQIGYITHPWMNDVHHVRSTPWSTLLVTSTGLDAILEFSADGELLNINSVVHDNLWEKFDQSLDYRKILTTKPYEAHPNFVFILDNRVCANRMNQRDVVSIPGREPVLNIEVEQQHDGLLWNDKIHFTTVDGRILIFDAHSRERLTHLDLNTISKADTALGWCRGIQPLDEQRAIVGFSRLRPTKWKEHLHWMKYRLSITDIKIDQPTRIACYNHVAETLEWEFNLESRPANMGEVFSILPWRFS